MAQTQMEAPFDIPPAFYRDDDPPLPPPGDPHRREWPGHGGHEPTSPWLLYILPAGLIAGGMLLFGVKLALLIVLAR